MLSFIKLKMAQTQLIPSPSPLLLLASIACSLLPLSLVSSSPNFNAIVSPITKDTSTSLYTIPINKNTPLVLDLNGPLLWSLCSPHHPTIPCNSSTCAAAKFQPPNCANNSTNASANPSCHCTVYPVNPVTANCSSGDLTTTSITTNATDGKNPTFALDLSDIFSSCAPPSLLSSLPTTATGVAGLGNSNLSLPSQLSSFNLQKQFALCLPSGGTGVAFFGRKPFDLIHMTGNGNISDHLTYTELVKNPTSPAYYIEVQLIAVNTKAVTVPAKALRGGVMLTTSVPYTALRSDVYKPFLKAYDKASSYIQRVAPVKPFELCYNSSTMGSTRMGYAVPQIDLVLNGGKNWTIFGGNSIVQVDPVTACFGFVDAGPKADNAIQIGGFQMENILVLFDLETNRMGYTGLLFGIMTTCSNFNFTYAGGF